MKWITTLFKKKAQAVTLLMLFAAFSNNLLASPVGVFRVFWNKFEITLNNDKGVVLTWNVTEYNNKTFQIQHSVNGTDWENVAVVPSKNSVETSVDYSYTHSNKLSGKQFYRIQELDVDVKATGFSPIRTLMLQNDKPVISLWPNPATSHVLITDTDNGNIYTRARVFDLAGKVMVERKLDFHSNKIAINELLPGTYIIQIENEKGAKYSQKIIKQ